MTDSPQPSLFAPDTAEASRPLSDRDLLRDAADAALFLNMGPDEGLGTYSRTEMRRQLVESVAVLATRWNADVSA